MTLCGDGPYEEREIDLTVLSIGNDRIAVAKVLRAAGWSYQGVREVLTGLVNWFQASGLVTAHKLAEAGMVLHVEDRVYRLTYPWVGAEPLPGERYLASFHEYEIGPGHTTSRRGIARDWAREFP